MDGPRLSQARARWGDACRIARERAEHARREAEQSPYAYQANQPGAVGEVARQQLAVRRQAAENAAAELARLEQMSDAEVVEKYAPLPPEPTGNLTDTLARGARIGPEIAPTGWNGYHMPGDYRVGAR